MASKEAEKPAKKKQRVAARATAAEDDDDDEVADAPAAALPDDDAATATATLAAPPTSLLRKNEDGDAYLDLNSSTRRVTVRKFKGSVLVDIREFYEKSGKMLPGKKGISLTVPQYEALRDAITSGAIDAAIVDL